VHSARADKRDRQRLRAELAATGIIPDREITHRLSLLAQRQAAHRQGRPVDAGVARALDDLEQQHELRARLHADGQAAHLIDQVVARLARRQDAARRAGVPLRQLDDHLDRQHTRLDDRGYRPDAGDPLLRGAARATGATAAAAKRRKTITRYQHDHLENP
jgi:hypothetical protein